jgi:hypothetical protein
MDGTEEIQTKVFRAPSPAMAIPDVIESIIGELESLHVDVTLLKKIAADMEADVAQARELLVAGDIEGAKQALNRVTADYKGVIFTLRMVRVEEQRHLPVTTARNIQSTKEILETTVNEMVKIL